MSSATAALDAFQQKQTAPIAWIDLGPQSSNYVINFVVIDAAVKGFQEIPYFESLPGFDSIADCPLDVQP